MKRLGLVLITAISFLAISSPAMALTPFKTAFKKKYADKHPETKFKDAVKKASCSVCHIPEAKKKGKIEDHLNPYGQELAKIITGNAKQRIADARKEGGKDAEKAEKEKVAKELEKAFEEVAKKKSKSGDTFGALIKAGKLPGATEK